MGFVQAVEIADRMASTAPERIEQPKNHMTPLRYTYGSKKRKAKRLASQAKGLYDVSANSEHWFVLARSPQRALQMVNEQIAYLQQTYSEREIRRICGVTVGTKERIL